jgi:antitoxin ParD1/3/4
VDGGRYMSASEVLRDGLRLLEEQEELRAIKLCAKLSGEHRQPERTPGM